jgi:mono/diheme cytochrome c family protein
MRARRVIPLLLVLASVALVASGCFSSKVASTTINGEITIGQGTTAKTENPAGTGGSATTGQTTGETTAASTASTDTTGGGGQTTGGESTAAATTGAGGSADLAAGKTAFSATCGGCHTLKDAGTNGQVGPNLDSLAPLSTERVAQQIDHGGGAMPPKLLTGKDAANVAAYVSSVAGK